MKVLITTVFSSIFVSIIPVITSSLIDTYSNLEIKSIILYILVYIGAILLFLLMEYLEKIQVYKLEREYKKDYRHRIFESITILPHDVVNQQDDGSYENLVINDINNVFTNYFYCSIEFLMSLLSFLVYLVFMFSLNILLSIVIIISCLISILIPKIVGKEFSRLRKEESEEKANLIVGINDLLEQKNYFYNKTSRKFTKIFDDYNGNYENKAFQLNRYNSFVEIFSGFSLYFINITTFVFGLIFIYKGMVSIASFIAIIGYIDLVAVPIRDMIYQVITIKSSKDLLAKLEVYLHPAITDLEQVNNFSQIEVSNLNYRIGDFSLNNINVIFEKGKKYALVGENSTGKSLLMKLVCKERLPGNNMVFVDGKDILESDLNSLIFYCSKPSAFNANLHENVILSEDDELDEKAESILSEISSNDIDFGGKNLSYGEIAKVSIARAIQSGKEVLVLDEIFSNIDSGSEIELTDLLVKLDCTLILITHNRDEKYLEKFDCVYSMDELNKGN